MAWWTTKELETAKRLYRVGGVKAVQSVLPHRTRLAIWSQAREGKWEFWTRITPGSVAEQALKLAKDAPITATDLANELGMVTKNVSAILCQLHKREVMTRTALHLHTESKGPRMVYAYSPHPEFIKATTHETELL